MSEEQLDSLPKIHFYEDFAAFLGDYVARRKEQQSWFSARWIAKRAGIASPALLSMLMSRKRYASLELVERIARAIGLSHAETRFAVLLTEREMNRSQVLVDLVEREMAKVAGEQGWPWRLVPRAEKRLTVLGETADS